MSRPKLSLRLQSKPEPTSPIRVRNIKSVECPTCGAFIGERCSPGFKGHWSWCEKRILVSDGKIPDPNDPVDDDFWIDDRNFEQEEEERVEKHRAYLCSLSNKQLGKEWDRECNRHDSAVDRCEALNSPTIEDARGWMNFIERLFKDRGVSHHDFVMKDDEPTEVPESSNPVTHHGDIDGEPDPRLFGLDKNLNPLGPDDCI